MARNRATVALTLASGVLLVVVPFLVEFVSGDFFLLMGVALLLLAVAMPGLHRLQQGADGLAGAWGLRLTLGGLLVAVVLVLVGDMVDIPAVGPVAALAGCVALVGLVLFAVGMTRAGIYPSAGIWLFLAGMVVGLVSEAFEQSLRGPVPALADVLPPVGFVIAGVGLIVLARAAARIRPMSAGSNEAPVPPAGAGR